MLVKCNNKNIFISLPEIKILLLSLLRLVFALRFLAGCWNVGGSAKCNNDDVTIALRARKCTVSKTWKTLGTMMILDCGLLLFCFHRNNETGQRYRSEGWRQSFPSSSQLLSPFPFTCTRGRRSLRSIVIRIFHTPTRSISHTYYTYIRTIWCLDVCFLLSLRLLVVFASKGVRLFLFDEHTSLHPLSVMARWTFRIAFAND